MQDGRSSNRPISSWRLKDTWHKRWWPHPPTKAKGQITHCPFQIPRVTQWHWSGYRQLRDRLGKGSRHHRAQPPSPSRWEGVGSVRWVIRCPGCWWWQTQGQGVSPILHTLLPWITMVSCETRMMSKASLRPLFEYTMMQVEEGAAGIHGAPEVRSSLHSCLFKNLFYWNIVDLQCCVNFCYTAKWLSYTYVYSFLLRFITGYWI